MGYPKRICKPNLTYHICSRCIGGSHLMELNKFKDLFLKVLSMAEEKYRFEISNYVIMPNHFHIFIKTLCSEDTISQIMQFIKSQYATRYNKMTNRIGPFWNERFKDTIIDYTEDPLYVYNYICTYINFNPVRKNYVKDPRDYKYGCIWFYLDKNYEPRIKLTYNDYFLKLGETFENRLIEFLKYEEEYRKKIFNETIFI